MFEREHHLRIATILQALDADTLAVRNCLFGGGTGIELTHGEFRESIDVDFLISDKVGFRELRQKLTGPNGISSVVRTGFQLTSAREICADQYGIRTMLTVGGVEIKFEIVFEGRIGHGCRQISRKLRQLVG
ncbi:MAG: nucleotidyl transferase AbiEii/AbiGii toxin family protein [Bdellovibrionia bacterium]